MNEQTPADSTNKDSDLALAELGQAVHALIQNNLRYEVLIRAVVELLEAKKLPDGSSVLTTDELNNRAGVIRKTLIEQAQKAQKDALQPSAGTSPKSA